MKRSWQPTRKAQQGRKFDNPWYHTTAWRKLRAAHIELNPLCVMCKKEGRITAVQVVDHKVNVASGRSEQEREELMWNPANLQSLCNYHHNQKSAKERTK